MDTFSGDRYCGDNHAINMDLESLHRVVLPPGIYRKSRASLCFDRGHERGIREERNSKRKGVGWGGDCNQEAAE